MSEKKPDSEATINFLERLKAWPDQKIINKYEDLTALQGKRSACQDKTYIELIRIMFERKIAHYSSYPLDTKIKPAPEGQHVK